MRLRTREPGPRAALGGSSVSSGDSRTRSYSADLRSCLHVRRRVTQRFRSGRTDPVSLSKAIETSDDWIFSRSGIESRRFADGQTQTSDLAAAAAARALSVAETGADAIDLIVVATTTPDAVFRAPPVSSSGTSEYEMAVRLSTFKRCAAGSSMHSRLQTH